MKDVFRLNHMHGKGIRHVGTNADAVFGCLMLTDHRVALHA
jgi:hypothetical protein